MTPKFTMLHNRFCISSATKTYVFYIMMIKLKKSIHNKSVVVRRRLEGKGKLENNNTKNILKIAELGVSYALLHS